MRRTSPGLRVAPASCRLLTMILGLTLTSTSLAQAPATRKAATPPPIDTRPLARFAPGDRLVAYAEYLGVDALDAAWQKTNASKMLNSTTLGAMLEELGTQLVDKVVHHGAPSKTPGVEVVAMTRHILHTGFVFAGSAAGPDGKGSCVVLVIRGGARRDMAGMFARVLLSYGKPKIAKKGGRDVVVMPGSSPGSPGWAWWPEKEDLIIALDRPESADVVIEVLDGKRPNAVDHPVRAELVKVEDGLQPALVAFLDATTVSQADSKLKSAELALKAQSYGIKRVDFRWGFQDNALMSVLRLVAPRPRQGLLALLDGPTFDRTSLPPLPAGIEGFGVVSLQPAKVYDEAMAHAKAAGPDAEAKLKAAIEAFETQARVKLRSSVLAHLGPRMAFYVPPVVGKALAVAPGSAAVLPGPLALMVGLLQQSPRFAFVAEIDNPTAVGKSLDDMILWANGRFKAQAAAAPKPPPPAAGAAAADDDEPDGPPPAPEFERMPGIAKAYTLLMPSGLGKLPGNVRPSIRVGTNYIAVASSPEVAKLALEMKPNELWKPPADLAPAFAKLPTGLIGLGVGDPRETLPKTLASLPGTIQATLNTAILASQPPGGPAGGSPGPAPAPGASPAQPPGAPGANPAPAMIQLQVSPSKLPSADALKALMFPGTLAVAVDDQGVRVVRRQAFPNLSMEGGTMTALLLPAIQAARKAAAEAAARNAGGPGAVPGASAPGTTPGTGPKPETTTTPARGREPR